MFPGMGPLCTGQGPGKKKRTEGQRRWREAGGRCMGTEEGQVGKKQVQDVRMYIYALVCENLPTI